MGFGQSATRVSEGVRESPPMDMAAGDAGSAGAPSNFSMS